MPTISCIGTRAPSTCHGPVMPGVRWRRLRSSPSTCTSSSTTSGRGPTRLMSPSRTLKSWQLVERGATQEGTDARHARVGGDLEHPVADFIEGTEAILLGVGADHHRPELEDPEMTPLTPHANLSEEDGPLRVEADRQRDRRDDRSHDSRPIPAAMRSNARLSRCDERESPNVRTPSIVIPSTSSNSTDEPTTSSMRGSTLTRAPAALAIRISSTTPLASVAVGAMMMRCTCRSSTS